MKRLLPILAVFLFVPMAAHGQITVSIDTTIADKNCSDFGSILEAQGTYLAMQVLVQDSTADPFGLDADGDGIACASKDVVRRVAPVDTTGFWYETVEKVDEAKCPALTEPMNVDDVLGDIRTLPTEVMEDSTAYATLRTQVDCLRNLGLLLDGLPIPEPPPPPEDDTTNGDGGNGDGDGDGGDGGMEPSFSYAADCETNVDNATVHGPDEAGLMLPSGEPLAEGDTLSVVTPRDDCAGQTTVQASGFTVAAAMVLDTTDFEYQPGLYEGENFQFEIYDISDSTAYRAWPVFRPCEEVGVPICREAGFENDAFYEVDSLSVEKPLYDETADMYSPENPALQDCDATDSPVVMEAELGERFTAQVSDWEAADDSSASANVYVNTANEGRTVDPDSIPYSPRIEIPIEFCETGTHYLWSRAATSGEGWADNSFYFQLAESDTLQANNLENRNSRLGDRGAGDWMWIDRALEYADSTNYDGRLQFEVPSTGVHTLKVWMREDGTRLDELRLATSQTYAPEGAPVPEEPGTTGSLTVSVTTTYPYNEDNPALQSCGPGSPDNVAEIDAARARKYSYGDTDWVRRDTSTAIGNGYAVAIPQSPEGQPFGSKGDAALFDVPVNFCESGEHYLWLRVAHSGGAGGDNSFHVRDPTDTWRTYNDIYNGGAMDEAPTGAWTWVNTGGSNFGETIEGPMVIDVPSTGVHKLLFRMREGGIRIDEIHLTTAGDYSPM